VNTVYRKENRTVCRRPHHKRGKHADVGQLKKLKDRVVERRKLQKEYLQFIKNSQRFYRQYVLNLDTQIEGIPELRKIAFKWKDDGMSNMVLAGPRS